MVIRKEKKDKIMVRPKERKGEITPRNAFDIWSDFDRIFDNFRSRFDDLFWPTIQTTRPLIYDESRAPLADVADLGDRYEMHIEMPGIKKDNVNIEVTPNSIEISAECGGSEEKKGKNWLRRECSNMSYYRSLELPEEIKTDNVEAELKNGVLKLNIPKVEPKQEYKPTKVKIK
jgi:HSP20 family protein